jgi:hypothetical protein
VRLQFAGASLVCTEVRVAAAGIKPEWTTDENMRKIQIAIASTLSDMVRPKTSGSRRSFCIQAVVKRSLQQLADYSETVQQNYVNVIELSQPKYRSDLPRHHSVTAESVSPMKSDIPHLVGEQQQQLTLLLSENKALKEQGYESFIRSQAALGAISFFATLGDSNFFAALDRLVEESQEMLKFIDREEQLSFTDIRAKIRSLVRNTPYIVRVKMRLNNMHQKWAKERSKAFASRNLAGGDADMAALCPLCDNDMRVPPPRSFMTKHGNGNSFTPNVKSQRAQKLSKHYGNPPSSRSPPQAICFPSVRNTS